MLKNKKLFDVSRFLISIDGPDGVGKSSFTEMLKVGLRGIIGNTKIKLVRPTYFSTSRRAQQIGDELEKFKDKVKEYTRLHNSFFLDAMWVNYEDVILPAIQTEQIILLDSSEIRALAFILAKGDRKAIQDTRAKIKNGSLTCGIQPKTRIILNGEPNDLWKNLLTKDTLDKGDPRNIREIQKRIRVYKEAIETIRQLDVDDEIEWIIVNIQHVPNSLSEYLSANIQNKVLPNLKRILNLGR